MYKSDIAEDLKNKIDDEMKKLINNTNLISLEQRVTNIKSKEELETVKAQLISYNERVNTNSRTMGKQKVLVKMKEAGFIDAVTLALIVVFVMGIAVGIGYMLFRFGA